MAAVCTILLSSHGLDEGKFHPSSFQRLKPKNTTALLACEAAPRHPRPPHPLAGLLSSFFFRPPRVLKVGGAHTTRAAAAMLANKFLLRSRSRDDAAAFFFSSARAAHTTSYCRLSCALVPLTVGKVLLPLPELADEEKRPRLALFLRPVPLSHWF